MDRVLSAESRPCRFPMEATRAGPGNTQYVYIIDHHNVVIWKELPQNPHSVYPPRHICVLKLKQCQCHLKEAQHCNN